MNKQPKPMNFQRMRSLLEPHICEIREQVFINSELAVVRGATLLFPLLFRQEPPFSINDYRIGVITRGELHGVLNLVEKRITAGTLVFIGPGTIVSPIGISPDLEIHGIGLSTSFPMPFAPGQLPAAFNGQVQDFQLPVGEADVATALHIIDALWHIVRQPDYDRPTVSSLVAAQMHHYDRLFRLQTAQLEGQRHREQSIFDRFIQLVNQHATQHHQLAFYAQRMCLTERYLGTIVRQASGIGAKEWIDRAIVARIKVELLHTDKPIARLAEEMNFPNPSFFCKYFKRLEGQTPLEFRNS
ncbi:MAG: helix-turn-helix domain-containing protein [Bacteroidaceae bacterium]|nr:helix-turn-helix domain-containing protein [Bacteroidaceae bacterium]MBQ9190396.1 helix-turn-helix domain-containing protein [Bacteroidaceae bacterium]